MDYFYVKFLGGIFLMAHRKTKQHTVNVVKGSILCTRKHIIFGFI
mgnify:CR=1 FL=1